MKITCSRAELARALTVCQRAAESKGIVSILNCALIEGKDSGIKITAFDTTFGIQCNVAATVESPSRLAIPAKMLRDLVANCVGDEIVIEEAEGQKAHISCGNFSGRIAGMKADEFPEIPEMGAGELIGVKQSDFRRLIERTLFAVASSQIYQTDVIAGVLMEAKNQRLCLTATDKHRISRCEASVAYSGEDVLGVLPQKAASELKALIEPTDNAMSIRLGAWDAYFMVGDMTIYARLLTGKFPNCDRVTPKSFSSTWTMNTDELIKSINRIMLFAEGELACVSMTSDGDGVAIESSTKIGDASDRIAAGVNGTDNAVMYNARHVKEILLAQDAEEIDWNISDNARSAVISPVGDETATCVLAALAMSRGTA